MSYNVNYSDTNKTPITVQDNTLNTETGVSLVGKNYAGYGPALSANFVHLLENFANTTAPVNPIQGQLWYDTTSTTSVHPELKVWNGTAWTTTSNIAQGAAEPSSKLFGDLWVDTSTQQLKVYFGSWVVIGPQYSTGLKTGPVIEVVINSEDNTNVSIISFYVEEYRVAIVSSITFTPKVAISGFATLNQGITLNSIGSVTASIVPKFYGTSTRADSLNVSGTAIDALNFLRSDVTSTTTNPFNVQSDSGISIGSDLGFKILPIGNSIVLTSTVLGKNIDFKVNNDGTNQNLVRLNSNGTVGIGVNNINPQAVLDVSIANSGNTRGIITDGTIKVGNTTDSSGLGNTDNASLWTDGGLSVKLSSNFGGTINALGAISINNLDNDSSPVSGSVLTPGTTSVYDIGNSTHRFRNVYANTLIGDVIGNLTGSFTGNITGSASSLASYTEYKLQGDIVSDTVTFNGITASSDVSGSLSGVTFTTTLSDNFISNKSSLGNSKVNDYLLVYRPLDINNPTDPYGNHKMLKSTFVSSIPSVPIGAIFPYAGITIPAGYLLCDGGEVYVSEYPDLFQVIQYTYKASPPSGTFALPDLRGRFPLGPDNMDNGSLINVVGGGSANRVTATTADNVGQGAGSETRVLGVSNLPDHTHDLQGSLGNQYYAVGLSGGTQDSGAIANRGLPPTDVTNGYGLPNSGSMTSATTGQPFNTMNPYLTMNYIIFAGY